MVAGNSRFQQTTHLHYIHVRIMYGAGMVGKVVAGRQKGRR